MRKHTPRASARGALSLPMKLVVVEDGTRSALDLAGPVVRIGRALDNDVRLSAAQASRYHCRLEEDEHGVWVVDLESSNGTQVNGRRVERVLLGPGDVLGIGDARIHLEGGAERRDERRGGQAEGGGYATLRREGPAGDELSVYAAITRELAGVVELEPLLERIVDSAVALLGAERGFLLLAAPAAGRAGASAESLEVRVARSFDGSDIPLPASRLSKGVLARALEEGRPLLSVDAGRDERFSGLASVEDLRLRSVLALPIAIEGRIDGVLLVDNRLQGRAFGDAELALGELFAAQAAVALRNARLVGELRERNERLLRSSEQIKSLNERLGRKIRERQSELSLVRAELDRARGRYDYGSIVGASDEMRRVFRELDRIVETQLPVLIQGESGTGKELIAHAVHYNGPRRARPFVVENCAALPDTLLESELFGHTRGAFTGADRAKKGLFEQADGGTLFLDEIGDMSSEMQKKLLRVLQEGEVRPLGSNVPVKVDVRLLAASNQNLEQLVAAGRFREDLFYRVNVLTLRMPPLRERRDDVPLLAEHLLARAAREAGREAPVLPHEVLAALAAYDWPGNVRELENEMRRVLLLAEGSARLESLSPGVLRGESRAPAPAPGAPVAVRDLPGAVASFEQGAIEQALALAAGNKSRAAKELGISRFALQRKLDKYGMDVPGAEAEPAETELEPEPEA